MLSNLSNFILQISMNMSIFSKTLVNSRVFLCELQCMLDISSLSCVKSLAVLNVGSGQ